MTAALSVTLWVLVAALVWWWLPKRPHKILESTVAALIIVLIALVGMEVAVYLDLPNGSGDGWALGFSLAAPIAYGLIRHGASRLLAFGSAFGLLVVFVVCYIADRSGLWPAWAIAILAALALNFFLRRRAEEKLL